MKHMVLDRTIRLTLILATLLLAPAILPADRASAADDTIDLSTVLAEVRDRTGIPAISAAAWRDGRIVAQGTAGVRVLGDPAPARADDRFLIGSCAKSMLRLLAGRLVDKGLLTFDTTLGSALGEMPIREEYKSATIGQTLNHKGGIPPYTEIGPRITPWLFELEGSPTEQRSAFASHVLNEPPAAPPGTREIYSNAGYGIVAHVLERLAAKPWEEILAEQVFLPLGMASATVGLPTSEEKPDGPRGHFRSETGYEPVQRLRKPLPPIAPAGMVSCTISDFARYAGKLSQIGAGKPGDFLTASTASGVTEITPGGPDMDGVPFLGGEGTFTAAFALWPSRGLAIVVQTNGGESDEVCEAVIEVVRKKIAPDAPPSPPPPNGY